MVTWIGTRTASKGGRGFKVSIPPKISVNGIWKGRDLYLYVENKIVIL